MKFYALTPVVEPTTSAISPTINVFRALHQRWRHVLVLTHTGVSSTDPATTQLFIKVTNISPKREVEVTHVWIETDEGKFYFDNPEQPLTARLRLDETFETWGLVVVHPGHEEHLPSLRVRLSNEKTLKSRPNKDVPDVGYVAGGGETPYVAWLSPLSPGVTGVGPDEIEKWRTQDTSASATFDPAEEAREDDEP